VGITANPVGITANPVGITAIATAISLIATAIFPKQYQLKNAKTAKIERKALFFQKMCKMFGTFRTFQITFCTF
jgi:hypothetical protein